MRPVAIYTDFLVVCSGRNPRQATSIYDEVRERLKYDEGLMPRSVDGQSQGSWIIADYLDAVLHVFTPETRDFYRLEDLWGDVPQESVEAASA